VIEEEKSRSKVSIIWTHLLMAHNVAKGTLRIVSRPIFYRCFVPLGQFHRKTL